jgi:uncharacterized membrane protein YkvA (DUF1232 family)
VICSIDDVAVLPLLLAGTIDHLSPERWRAQQEGVEPADIVPDYKGEAGDIWAVGAMLLHISQKEMLLYAACKPEGVAAVCCLQPPYMWDVTLFAMHVECGCIDAAPCYHVPHPHNAHVPTVL